MTDKTKSAYLICGDDEYRVSTTTTKLLDELVPESERAFGLDRVDGRVGTVAETLDVLRAVNDALLIDGLFGDGNKTVWLREPVFLSNERVAKSEDVKKALADLVARIKEGLGEGRKLVVSTLKINRASVFFKAFAGADCKVIDFGSSLKPREKNAAAEMLVDEQLKELGFGMDLNVRQFFLARVGTDSRQIVSELYKLSCYCEKGQKATMDDVRAIVSFGAVSEMWDFTDAFATRNASALVKQIHIQLDQGEDPIRLANTLLSTTNDLLALREAFDKHWATGGGMSLDWSNLPPEIAEGLQSGERGVLALAGFPLKKKVEQARAWTVPELRAARFYLIELREALVSSPLPPLYLLETKLIQALGNIKRSAASRR